MSKCSLHPRPVFKAAGAGIEGSGPGGKTNSCLWQHLAWYTKQTYQANRLWSALHVKYVALIFFVVNAAESVSDVEVIAFHLTTQPTYYVLEIESYSFIFNNKLYRTPSPQATRKFSWSVASKPSTLSSARNRKSLTIKPSINQRQ